MTNSRVRLSLLVLVLVFLFSALACGGEPDEIFIDLPTKVPLTKRQIKATLVKKLTPPTPTVDVQLTRTASLKATQGFWPKLEERPGASRGYYLNVKDVEYLKIFGPVVWHASRVDLLVSGLYIGYISNNADLFDFFGRYELVDRAEQWKCHERLRQAVHREMLNLRRAHESLGDYEVGDVSGPVNGYANDLRKAVRSADISGNAFLGIQSEVCAPGYNPKVVDSDAFEGRRVLHDQIAINTSIFHRLMSQHGCAICGELYRR